MDPFEARLKFVSLLHELKNSSARIPNAISFLLKEPNLHEDLYSCIFEELNNNESSSYRLRLFYLLKGLLDAYFQNKSKSEDNNNNTKSLEDLSSWIIKDLITISSKVIGSYESNNGGDKSLKSISTTNLKSVKGILREILDKQYITNKEESKPVLNWINTL